MMKNFVLTCLLALNASAATYYIDFDSGSDSNNGTSKSSPWQRHPCMSKFGGSYRHQAGDQFIFKGGVTWPNACFTMHIVEGGAAGNPDYYGVDSSWYSGNSWSRPRWDAGGSELAGGYDVMLLFSVHDRPSNIILDNLDMSGLYWSGNKPFSWVAFVNLSYSANVTIQNCYIHNWSHAPMPTTDQLNVIMGASSAPYNPGCVVKNTIIDGENADNRTQGRSSGEASYSYSGDFINCTIRNLISGPIVTGDPNSMTPQVVSGCNIGPCYMSYDSTAHPDGLFMNGGRVFWWHDNYIHDCYVEAVFTGEGSNEDTYLWNNVIYFNKTHPPIEVDNFYSGARMWFWNNTLVGWTFPGVRIMNRNRGPLGVFDYRNNLVISDYGLLAMDPGASVNHYTNRNNLLLSTAQATAQGYTIDNLFQPTSSSNPTVGVGENLSGVLGGALTRDVLGTSRPSSGAWDIGAYQFSSSGAPSAPPPPPPPPSTPPSDQPGSQPESPTPGLTGLSWQAIHGTLTGSMVTGKNASGESYIYSATDATSLTSGALATYTFNITTAGNYFVSGLVSAADQEHNSVWVTIDQAVPDDPVNIWDLPITGADVWQKAVSSWRGNGSNVSPQIPLKSWYLTAGDHTLYIRGREGYTYLQAIGIDRVVAAPTNLRVVSLQP